MRGISEKNTGGGGTLLARILVLSMLTPSVSVSAADIVDFDLQTLQSRGVDPGIAGVFRASPRFLVGHSLVTITVNGRSRGKVNALFDEQGNLCISQGLLKQVGLQKLSGFKEERGEGACLILTSVWPQVEVTLKPGEAHVDIVAPQNVISSNSVGSDNWHHGGLAGLFNYDVQYMESNGTSSRVSFAQLGSEAGFNISDWIVRSRQTFSRFNNEETLQHQAAYAQRSFASIQKVLQFGQISLSNSMFGTGQVLGFQIFPEIALQNRWSSAGIVEGTADSQSVVEIRQSGMLVYNTTVPAGPFRLQGFPLLNTHSELDVSVTSSGGEKRQFVVPASAFLLSDTAVSSGLSFGAGQLDQQGASESPVLGTIAGGWALTPYTTMSIGGLASSPYRSLATGVDTQLFDGLLLSLQGRVSQDNRHNQWGSLVTSMASYRLTERVSVSANAAWQTIGYRELSDALQYDDTERDGYSRNQLGAGLRWSDETLGNLSLSWAHSTSFEGEGTDYLRASWSRQFGSVYMGASAERSTASGGIRGGDRYYLTLNVPFGSGRSISSYLNGRIKGGSRAGWRYNDRSLQDWGWNLSGEKDFRNHRISGTAGLDVTTSVSQLSASLSRDSNSYTSWFGRATGSVVAHDYGVTLSPYRVGDTFGVAKVGEESGVRLETASGPAWTDSRGYVVLPSLSGFRRSAVQIDTRSLARNVDINNAWQETDAARGSINYVNFDVVRTRRVLATVTDARGYPLSHGASVFDSGGKFVTVVGENGNVFIPDVSLKGIMGVQSSGKTLCTFILSLPEKAETSKLYETTTAKCR